MSDKSKTKITLDKEGLLQRLDLLGYEAYKKLLDLEDKIKKKPINRMSINVVRLDYILPLPILLYTFDINQKIQYEEMNRNKDEELAYIKLENMDAAYASNNYTLIDYTVIPFNPDFDGIMTKNALIDAVEKYNKLYEEGQKQLFGSKTYKKKIPGPTSEVPPSNATFQVSDTTSQVTPGNKDELIEYAYEIPKWMLKKNKRIQQMLKKKELKKLKKLNYINKDVDIKSLKDKFPSHEDYFVIEENDKEGHVRIRYTGDEPTIITEIEKLNNQPVVEYKKLHKEKKENTENEEYVEYDHKIDGEKRFNFNKVKKRQTRGKSKKKDESKKKRKEKKVNILDVLAGGYGKKTKKEKTKK